MLMAVVKITNKIFSFNWPRIEKDEFYQSFTLNFELEGIGLNCI